MPFPFRGGGGGGTPTYELYIYQETNHCYEEFSLDWKLLLRMKRTLAKYTDHNSNLKATDCDSERFSGEQ